MKEGSPSTRRGGVPRVLLRGAWWSLAMTMAIGSSASLAQVTAPIPPLSEDRVYAVGVPDEYGALRDEIARLERESPQTYRVVVLRSAGSGRRAIRDYLDALVERWEEQARRGPATFDRRRGVVIVVDLQNRRIIVLGGEELQERFGFRDPYIERELLAPHFYPHAKAGNTERGLRVLVGQIDRWIAERDQELKRRREEIAAREARLRTDVQAALESGRGLRDEARRQLDERKAAGLALGALEARFRAASGELDAAGQRLDTAPSEALGLVQQAQRSLQDVLDAIRRLSARQAENDDRLQAASARAGEVLGEVEAMDRRGLPVEPIRRDHDAARSLIEQAREANLSEPDRSADLIARAERGLVDVLAHARSLPDLSRQATEKVAALASLERAARAEFERAREAGVVDEALAKDWDAASGRLANARERAGTDPRAAVADLDEAERSLRSIRDRAAGAADRHHYATRTLPALILGFAIVAAATIFAWLWQRRRQAQRALDTQFQGFREHAVGLMERLDALRARHGKLADADPDYAEPMTGATRTLYQEVEADLNRLWDRWLRVMDAWERAQSLARTGSTFRTREFDEARGLLEREGNFEEITAEVESCRERVERLEQAHERAREALDAFRAEGDQFRQSLEELRAAGLAPTSYRTEFDPIAAVASGSEAVATADPIGAGQALTQAREALAALGERVGRVKEQWRRSEELRRAIEDVASRAAELRAGGLRLAEEAADPGPRLATARRLVEAAVGSLQEADPEAAAARLDEARSALDGAAAGIDRHLAARESVAREREAIREVEARLDRSAAEAARIVEELEASFAPGSWQPVAGNLDAARALRDEARERLDEADRAASDEVQSYVLASGLLDEAAGRLARAERLLAALADWRGNLASLAGEVREGIDGLEGEFTRISRFFEHNRAAIGPEAERSRAAAEALYRRLAGGIREPRPDWSDLRAQTEALRRGLAVAQEQAESDVEGFRRAAERLEQVRQRARQVEALLAREEKDRPQANQRYRAASQELAELERDAQGEPGSWDRRLRRLDEIAANLDRAEALAGQDIKLANAANAEIAEAARVIREARAYYQSGIAVDVSAAESQLNRARGSLKTLAYEQAIEQANAAEHQAREAFDRAAYAARGDR